MGVYYYAVCHEKREIIDPGKIAGGVKKSKFVYYQAGNVVAFAMLERWYGCQAMILGDGHYQEMERIQSYADVSGDVVREFNEQRPDGEDHVEFNPNG